jgi:hypothetical protein
MRYYPESTQRLAAYSYLITNYSTSKSQSVMWAGNTLTIGLALETMLYTKQTPMEVNRIECV